VLLNSRTLSDGSLKLSHILKRRMFSKFGYWSLFLLFPRFLLPLYLCILEVSMIIAFLQMTRSVRLSLKLVVHSSRQNSARSRRKTFSKAYSGFSPKEAALVLAVSVYWSCAHLCRVIERTNHRKADRLREIAQEFIHLPTPIPSAPPTPVAPPAPLEEPSSETEPVPAPVPAETPELPSSQPVVLTSGSAVIPTTGSFQFMNASELDAETMAAPAHDPLSDSTAEWVQVSTPTHEPVVSDTVLSEEVQKLVEEETQEIRNEQDAGLPAEAAAATDVSFSYVDEMLCITFDIHPHRLPP